MFYSYFYKISFRILKNHRFYKKTGASWFYYHSHSCTTFNLCISSACLRPNLMPLPVRHYLLFEKWWTDKCRFAWECAAALFLSSSIIFKMQSRQVVRSWATARMSLIVKEDKSSMKNFIESPSFPELRKQARKTNESKE